MKRFISVILCVFLLFSLIGCKETSNTDTTSSIITEESEVNEQEVIEEEKDFNIKLTFTGDMILACQQDITSTGSFNEYANNYPSSYFLDKVRYIFQQDDFTIVNLENVLSDNQLTAIYKDYSPAFWFKSKASNIDILSCSSVEGVSINNNHINDYGSQGVADTIAAIEGEGCFEYGTSSKIMYFEKNEFIISVVCVGLWGSYSTSYALSMLETAKSTSDYQIIFFHGGTEKLHSPEDWKISAAHTLVDNGADLIVGSHPHVLQPREVYNGVEILYSIGNFCYGGARRPENRTIIYQMEITVNENKEITTSQSNIIPCYVYTGNVNNYQPAVIDDEAVKQTVLDFMDGNRSSPL